LNSLECRKNSTLNEHLIDTLLISKPLAATKPVLGSSLDWDAFSGVDEVLPG
jgi:hypothetical protein